MNLVSHVENFETLVIHPASLAPFVVLDLGSGLPTFAQRLMPICNERVIVMEGMPATIQQTRYLIDEIAELGIDRSTISVILNNRQRSEAQMPWAQVQDKLNHAITAAITPAPELLLQALRLQTPAVIAQPTNMTSQQFIKIADTFIEREKAR